MTDTTITLPLHRGGAKATLLTVLGEFVLPAGGSVWMSTLLTVAGELGIGEKNARQAVARTRDQGLLTSERHGRSVRWELTDDGRDLLESGTRRIYGFGSAAEAWQGAWIVVHCPVAESRRTVRNQLRTRLGFLGFGELSPSLFVSPHVEREADLRGTLGGLGLLDESIVLVSEATTGVDAIVRRAWDLDTLAASYRSFVETVRCERPTGPADTFRAVVELVHQWRRFPFVDPELPSSLLPHDWIGTDAFVLFHDRHRSCSPVARRWFDDLERDHV